MLGKVFLKFESGARLAWQQHSTSCLCQVRVGRLRTHPRVSPECLGISGIPGVPGALTASGIGAGTSVFPAPAAAFLLRAYSSLLWPQRDSCRLGIAELPLQTLSLDFNVWLMQS